MPLVGPLSASDGNSIIQVSGSIEVLAGNTIAVQGGGDPGLYLAGDGLDLSGETFSTDLKSGGGLKIDTTELAVEVNDFAGTGLEDDSSDNLRIAASAAGTGLSGGAGSALSIDNSVVATLSGSQFSSNVGVTGSLGVTGALTSDHISGSITTLNDGSPLILGGTAITVASGSGDQITITSTDTTYTAGDGLDLSGTTFLVDLKSSGGLKIDSTELAVEPSDFAGDGLQDDGEDGLRISTTAAGTGLQGGGGSPLEVGAGIGINVAATTVGIDNTVVATLSGSQFSGNVGVTGSISASGQLSGSNLFADVLSGSLTTLTDGRPYILGGTAITITSGAYIPGAGGATPDQITIASSDTTYTAGDGLDLSGTEFTTDLKSGGGLHIDSTELAIDNTVVATLSGSQFSGNIGVTGSIEVYFNNIAVTGSIGCQRLAATGQISGSSLFVDAISGSLTTLTDGTAYIRASTNITVVTSSDGSISISSTDTTYTAGDGLDLVGTVFKTDLKSAGGLHIDSTELAVDHDIIPYLTGAIFSGPVGVTGSLTATGRIVSSNGTSEFSRIDVGGGYGSTGTTLFANGDVSMDGDLVTTNVTVGDGNFYAAAGQTLVLNSPHHIIMKLDTDNNGTTSFQIDNGAGTEILNVNESGNLQIDGDLTVSGNDIKDSGTNTQISFTAGSKATFPLDVDVTGNITGSNLWLDNDGTTEDVVLKIGDGTPYLGITQNSDNYEISVAGTGYASRPIQIGRDDGNHTVTISADEADVQGNLTISGDLSVGGAFDAGLSIATISDDLSTDNQWIKAVELSTANNTQATATAVIAVQWTPRVITTFATIGAPKTAYIHVLHEVDGTAAPVFTVDFLDRSSDSDPSWTLSDFTLTYNTSAKTAEIWIKAPHGGSWGGFLYGTKLLGSKNASSTYNGQWDVLNQQSWAASITSLGTDVNATTMVQTHNHPGIVLGYTAYDPGSADTWTTTGTSFDYVTDESNNKKSITFTAPPSEKVEITVKVWVNQNVTIAADHFLRFALTANNSSWSSVSGTEKTVFLLSEHASVGSQGMANISWAITSGLTAGTEYTYYLGGSETDAVQEHVLIWGEKYPALIMKAISLPDTITS